MQSFFALIDQLNACAGAERKHAEETVWQRFGVEKAILALDMSQFSLSVRRDGILPYLGSIRCMHVVTEPIVRAKGGQVVKYIAYKLGEDLARPKEILITAAARARLAPGFPHALSEQPVSFSGVQITAYGVLYA